MTDLATIRTAPARAVPAGALIVDVRTAAEFAALHAQGARLVPLQELVPGKLAADAGGAGPIYLICKSGKRAWAAAERCAAARLEVCVIEGGTDAWVAAGLAVVRGRGGISLERQVRIAAGLLVLTGALLGWLAHPGFFGLSAFVGAGLVFAGITDTCGMGMILARMPWNSRKSSPAD